MPGEPGDRLHRGTEWGWGGSRKWRPRARVPPTEDVGEHGGQECKCDAQRKASKWRPQKPSAACPGHLCGRARWRGREQILFSFRIGTIHTAFLPPGFPPQSVQEEPLLLLASS